MSDEQTQKNTKGDLQYRKIIASSFERHRKIMTDILQEGDKTFNELLGYFLSQDIEKTRAILEYIDIQADSENVHEIKPARKAAIKLDIRKEKVNDFLYLVLVGGKGSRMFEGNIPKPLLPLGGYTILENLCNQIAYGFKAGVNPAVCLDIGRANEKDLVDTILKNTLEEFVEYHFEKVILGKSVPKSEALRNALAITKGDFIFEDDYSQFLHSKIKPVTKTEIGPLFSYRCNAILTSHGPADMRNRYLWEQRRFWPVTDIDGEEFEVLEDDIDFYNDKRILQTKKEITSNFIGKKYIMVLFGDAVYTQDTIRYVRQMANELLTSDNDAGLIAMLGSASQKPGRYVTTKIGSKTGLLDDISHKVDNYDGPHMALYVLNVSALDPNIFSQNVTGLSDILLKIIKTGKNIHVIYPQHKYHDVNNVDSYRKAKIDVYSDRLDSLFLRSLDSDRTYIGEPAKDKNGN